MKLRDFQKLNKLFGASMLFPGQVVKVTQPPEPCVKPQPVVKEKRSLSLGGSLFDSVSLIDENILIEGRLEVNDMYVKFYSTKLLWCPSSKLGVVAKRDHDLLQAYEFRLDLRDIQSCAVTSIHDVVSSSDSRISESVSKMEKLNKDMQHQNIIRLSWTNKEFGFSKPPEILLESRECRAIMEDILHAITKEHINTKRHHRLRKVEVAESLTTGCLITGLFCSRDDTTQATPYFDSYDNQVHKSFLKGEINEREACQLRYKNDEAVNSVANSRDWTIVGNLIEPMDIKPPVFANDYPSKIFENRETLALLRDALPDRLKTQNWRVEYDFDRHGVSLKLLYDNVQEIPDTYLFCKTTKGETFGAYCSEAWCKTNSKRFYGTGESFLFAVHEEKLFVHRWTGANDFIMNSSSSHLAMGAGGGFAFCIDEDLDTGTSSACETFGNETPLCQPEFRLAYLEVISFVTDASLHTRERRGSITELFPL